MAAANSLTTGLSELLELLDRLAPSYGDDWWFTAHHGMAYSENGERDVGRQKIGRSLAQNPRNPWAAHARAHLGDYGVEPRSAGCRKDAGAARL